MTLWTVARQAPLSMEFSRQEYWCGLSFPPPGALPDLGIKPSSPMSPVLQADFLPTEPLRKPHILVCVYIFFFRFFSFTDHYKILSIVPCATQ